MWWEAAGCRGGERNVDQSGLALSVGERENSLSQGITESPGGVCCEGAEGLLGAGFLRGEDGGLGCVSLFC